MLHYVFFLLAKSRGKRRLRSGPPFSSGRERVVGLSVNVDKNASNLNVISGRDLSIESRNKCCFSLGISIIGSVILTLYCS